MKALVTGVAGFIGSHLAGTLLDRGAAVTGVDCFTDYYPRPIKEANLAAVATHDRFRFVETSIQEADLGALLDGVTHVFHLAAQAGVRKSWGKDFAIYTVNNIEATQMLLEAAVKVPLERFVYSSSSSVYGDHVPMPMREDAVPQPVSPYGVSKLAAEQLCYLYFANFGVPTVSLRYFTVYGPRQRPDMFFRRVCERLLDGRPFQIYGTGEQSRSFTYVGDVVAATRTVLERAPSGATYNVGGGDEASMLEAIALFEEISGRSLAVEHEGVVKGDMARTSADISRIRDDTGWEPQTPLRDGLAAMWSWAAARVAAA